eukprot:scaffold5988_cov381-Prasinococcus_capsulatus_cf.AAC.10
MGRKPDKASLDELVTMPAIINECACRCEWQEHDSLDRKVEEAHHRKGIAQIKVACTQEEPKQKVNRQAKEELGWIPVVQRDKELTVDSQLTEVAHGGHDINGLDGTAPVRDFRADW